MEYITSKYVRLCVMRSFFKTPILYILLLITTISLLQSVEVLGQQSSQVMTKTNQESLKKNYEQNIKVFQKACVDIRNYYKDDYLKIHEEVTKEFRKLFKKSPSLKNHEGMVVGYYYMPHLSEGTNRNRYSMLMIVYMEITQKMEVYGNQDFEKHSEELIMAFDALSKQSAGKSYSEVNKEVTEEAFELEEVSEGSGLTKSEYAVEEELIVPKKDDVSEESKLSKEERKKQKEEEHLAKKEEKIFHQRASNLQQTKRSEHHNMFLSANLGRNVHGLTADIAATFKLPFIKNILLGPWFSFQEINLQNESDQLLGLELGYLLNSQMIIDVSGGLNLNPDMSKAKGGSTYAASQQESVSMQYINIAKFRANLDMKYRPIFLNQKNREVTYYLIGGVSLLKSVVTPFETQQGVFMIDQVKTSYDKNHITYGFYLGISVSCAALTFNKNYK